MGVIVELRDTFSTEKNILGSKVMIYYKHGSMVVRIIDITNQTESEFPVAIDLNHQESFDLWVETYCRGIAVGVHTISSQVCRSKGGLVRS